MAQFISKFFAKKQPDQQDDAELRAQAALQLRFAHMVQQHIAFADVSASSQMQAVA